VLIDDGLYGQERVPGELHLRAVSQALGLKEKKKKLVKGFFAKWKKKKRKR
jgi:hypothetical protein